MQQLKTYLILEKEKDVCQTESGHQEGKGRGYDELGDWDGHIYTLLCIK